MLELKLCRASMRASESHARARTCMHAATRLDLLEDAYGPRGRGPEILVDSERLRARVTIAKNRELERARPAQCACSGKDLELELK
jgi:hypothetical protein